MPRILLKCGGFSTQLAKHVGDTVDGDPLWGSRFDKENPQAVVQTHIDFLENGADIILTNTYQSSVEGFMKYLHLSREESMNCIRNSVRLAREAKDKYLRHLEQTNSSSDRKILILGSIGPYGAMLHDGSEYNGSYAEKITPAEMQNWHRTRIECILEEGVDGLAIETIPCQVEAEALTDLLLNDYSQEKFWISFQCKDVLHLAHGERFSYAVMSLWNKIQVANATERLLGIGVNCVNPKIVAPLLKSLHDVCPLNGNLPPLLVYSNSGETYDTNKGEWINSNECVPLENYAPEWMHLGVKIIGGCCRVYPKDILRLRKYIDSIASNSTN